MKKIIFFILIALIVVASGVFYLFDFVNGENACSDLQQSSFPGTTPSLKVSDSPTPTCTPTPVLYFYVHVCGHVVTPGVYTVPAGGRLEEVIEMAGGFSWSADTEYLNLARILSDGERVYVPSVYETEELSLQNRINGEAVVSFAEHTQKAESDIQIININRASLSEIQTLPGIGEKKAQDIIKYRETVGPFETIEEIKNISGIGEALFLKLRDIITVE